LTGPADAAVAIVRGRLAAHPAALPFAEAVVRQLTGAPGPLASAPVAAAEALAGRVAALLLAVGRADVDSLAAGLLEEPELAAAVFQNLDLLYAHPWGRADSVSLLLGRVLELASRAEGDA
jgi:hypothetical protein